MATTDLHAQILPYDYYADAPTTPRGLALITTLIRRLRASSANSLLFDNGDFLQGNPLADQAAGADGPHPVIAAMNAAGYDAATLGNHEFNYGLPLIERLQDEAAFPVVCANITRHASDNRLLARPWVVLEREITDDTGRRWPLRLGVIGFAPPQVSMWERLTLGDRISARDIVLAASDFLPAMQAAGAEIIVALCHSGVGPDEHVPAMENAALPLSRVPGIDVLVTGHAHGLFPSAAAAEVCGADVAAGTLNGVPAVMPGSHGSHLGVIDLRLSRKAGRWQVTGHTVSLLAAGDGGDAGDAIPDPAIAKVIGPAHAQLLDSIRRPVGHTPRPVDSHFALLRADDSLRLVAEAQLAYAGAALRGTEWAGRPMLSAVAPFRTGGRAGPAGYIDIPVGPVSMRHAAELYLYPNAICAVEVTAPALQDWLERAAGLFLTVTPGEIDQPLIDPDFPAYNFDMLFGLTWCIDPSVPAHNAAGGGRGVGRSGRVSEIRWQGRALDPDDRFIVVTNSYRAGGGGGLVAPDDARMVLPVGRAVRDVVIDYLREPLLFNDAPVWRFADLPGTAAWVTSAPGADASRAPGLDLRDRGLTDAGFRRFDLHFGTGCGDRQPGLSGA